jgi:hypothetical protein
MARTSLAAQTNDFFRAEIPLSRTQSRLGNRAFLDPPGGVFGNSDLTRAPGPSGEVDSGPAAVTSSKEPA